MGAQRGLVLSITPEGGIVQWSGARPDTSLIDPSHLVGMVELLPYQDGVTLLADNNDHGLQKSWTLQRLHNLELTRP